MITYLKAEKIIVKGSDEAKHRLLVVNLQNLGTNRTTSMRTEVCTCARGFHVTQLSVANLNDRAGVCAVPVFDKLVIPVIRATLADGGSTYIHCHSGVARAPTLTLALLFNLCRELNFRDALEIVQASRLVAFLNQGHQHTFREQLRSFYTPAEPETKKRRAADKTADDGPQAIPDLVQLPAGKDFVEITMWAPVNTTDQVDDCNGAPEGRGGRGRGGRGA